MATFKDIQPEAFPKKSTFLTQEELQWKQYSLPVTVKDSALIQHVDISTEDPFQFAISSSNRIQIFNPASRDVTCRLTKFKLNAFGATFRGDNRLIGAGSDEGTVRLFDIKTKALLRQFVGHSAPTRRIAFVGGGQNIVSFSDDMTVALWDIPQQSRVSSFAVHKDYVRCGRMVPGSSDLVLTGSYDQTASIIDIRSGEAAITVAHGAPVEAVEMLPSGSIFFTAGGSMVNVWDASTGRRLAQLRQHHKTVTSLCVSPCGQKLLSGSLDRHVKVYDVLNYQVVHSVNYPSPILCLAMAKDSSVFVVGSETGLITIHRKIETKQASNEKSDQLRKAIFVPGADDIVLDTAHFTNPTKLQNQLKRFEFTAAIQTAFNQASRFKKPEIFIATCDEVARRRMLDNSIEKLSEKYQNAILDFICKYISLPRYETALLDLIDVLTRVLQERREWDDVLWLKFEDLQYQVNKLFAAQNDCKKIVAMIETLSMKTVETRLSEPMFLEPMP